MRGRRTEVDVETSKDVRSESSLRYLAGFLLRAFRAFGVGCMAGVMVLCGTTIQLGAQDAKPDPLISKIELIGLKKVNPTTVTGNMRLEEGEAFSRDVLDADI